ncbi:MAG: hypothetical protein HYR64_09175 [Fimbriimonas ginsengisoli]|uniref:Uncharacterized protein n=1 Tax=Fimbriimonas ginsengisoli TaxID=1005039 RepID=A0A931LW32_FIMGI|nr:hypothetical protein [Fimbriimonas ginsengisoli]
MRAALRFAVLALAAATILSGCHFKSLESYESATTPNSAEPGRGDPYTNGGIAGASGGQKARASYATSEPALGGKR